MRDPEKPVVDPFALCIDTVVGESGLRFLLAAPLDQATTFTLRESAWVPEHLTVLEDGHGIALGWWQPVYCGVSPRTVTSKWVPLVEGAVPGQARGVVLHPKTMAALRQHATR